MPSDYPPRLKVLETTTTKTTTTTTPPPETTTTTYPTTTTTTSPGFLEITDVYWVVNDYRTYEAREGDYVKVCVVIRAVGGNVRASLTIKIKEDNRGIPDKTFAEQTFDVNLISGQEKVLSLGFIASKTSSIVFRGYFIEVYVNGEKYYTMPSDYPPRLKVQD